jgi:hypothetical protein
VGTVSKSIAAMSSLWFRRNAVHRSIGSALPDDGAGNATPSFPNVKTELYELGVDTWGTPPILGHRPDQVMNLCVDARPPRTGSPGNLGPIPAASSSMPSGDRIGLDDDKSTRQGRPRLAGRHPESSIDILES